MRGGAKGDGGVHLIGSRPSPSPSSPSHAPCPKSPPCSQLIARSSKVKEMGKEEATAAPPSLLPTKIRRRITRSSSPLLPFFLLLALLTLLVLFILLLTLLPPAMPPPPRWVYCCVFPYESMAAFILFCSIPCTPSVLRLLFHCAVRGISSGSSSSSSKRLIIMCSRKVGLRGQVQFCPFVLKRRPSDTGIDPH